jgi:MFS family permease
MNMTGSLLSSYWHSVTYQHISRSRILSLNIGLLFIGMAVGPTLGSFLIRATGQALSVFYGAVICTLLYSVLIWFILPESVTEQQMTRARAKYNDDLRKAAERQRASAAAFLPKIRWATSFLSPLTIFLPVSYKSPNNVANPGGRDWSLTLLALAYGCTISIMANGFIHSHIRD